MTSLMCLPASAVFNLLIETDNTGGFVQGGYTPNAGDTGVVQANVAAGSYSDTIIEPVLVAGMTSGVVSTSIVSGRANSNVDFAVSVTGGTADFTAVNSSANDAGRTRFNSVGLTNLAGVTSISFTVDYDQYIGGRDDARSNLISRPMLSALGLIDAGTGLGINNFDVAMSLSDTFHSSDGVNFLAGAPGVASFSSAAWDSISGGGLDYAADGFSGTVPGNDSDANFLLVRGFDFEGDNYDAADAQRFYAQQMTWTITPRDGVSAFAADTTFVFSLDGEQYANIINIPEAGVSALSLIACLTALGIRRRK